MFASDAMSSVAYATGEIFIQLTIVSLVFKNLVMPISLAIAALMTIVVPPTGRPSGPTPPAAARTS